MAASRIWDREFAKAVDRHAIEHGGIKQTDLMERAGAAVAQHLLSHRQKFKKILVLVGRGNNGGDALIAARLLTNAGIETIVCPLESYRPGDLKHLVGNIDAIIDGVLGIGFRPPLNDESICSLLKEARALNAPYIVAVDIPSGMDADGFAEQNILLPANVTITFGGYKPAHVVAPARDSCGAVRVIDIGFGSANIAVTEKTLPPLLYNANPEDFTASPLDKLPPSAHKFDRGHVLVIGGSEGKTGAPLLSALAALRAGAGWASVALPTSIDHSHENLPLELTFESFFDGKSIDAAALLTFLDTRNVKAVVVGPGTMEQVLDHATLKILSDFSRRGGFVVCDAGATKNLCSLLESSLPNGARFLATPHPGEWQRLGGELPPALEHLGMLKTVSGIVKNLGVTLCHKGATPLIFAGDDTPLVCHANDHSIAKAGTGDLVAGLAATYGMHYARASEAMLKALFTLADTAALLKKVRDPHSLTASDLLAYIGRKEQ